MAESFNSQMETSEPLSDADMFAVTSQLLANTGFPAELISMVAAHIDPADVVRLSAVSRALHKLSVPIIYRDVSFSLDSESPTTYAAGKSLARFVRTMVTDTGAASAAVRRLSFTGKPLQRWRFGVMRPGLSADLRYMHPPELKVDLRCLSLKDQKLYGKLAQDTVVLGQGVERLNWQMTTVICVIIARAGLLEHLRIDSHYLCSRYFSLSLERLIDGGNMPALRTLELRADLASPGIYRKIWDGVRWNKENLAFLRLPRLQHMHTVLSLRGSEDMNSHSALTKLTLHHYKESESCLKLLLAATPQLRYFEYHPWISLEEFFGDELEELADALPLVATSLETLIVKVRFDHPCRTPCRPGSYDRHIRPLARMAVLPQLTRLTRLVIPYEAIVGTRPNLYVDWPWDRVFPKSLRDLTFQERFDEFVMPPFWNTAALVPIYQSLSQWLIEECSETCVFIHE